MKGRGLVIIAVAGLLLAGGLAFAQVPAEPGPVDVFVSNPVLGQIWKVSFDGSDWIPPTEPLLEVRKTAIEDLIVGPDDRIYACAPNQGRILSLEQDGSDVRTLYDASKDDGPAKPQCGWFAYDGRLYVTDRSTSGLWYYQGGQFHEVPYSFPANFFGQGITAAARGDLLFVDEANATVWNLPFNTIFDYQVDDLEPLISSGLASPVGIARAGNGDIFVTDGGSLWIHDDEGTPYATQPSPFAVGFDARFLAFASDDRLFVATTSPDEANLVEVVIDFSNYTYSFNTILTFAKQPDADGEIRVNKPAMSGVAVSRSSRDGVPTDPPAGSTADYYFNFKDHAYELTLSNTVCSPTPTVIAQEMPPHCLKNLIDCYVGFEDNNDDGDVVTGFPVTYAGDGGMAQLYWADGTCTETVPELGAISHAISAYTDLVNNPRVVRCDDAVMAVDFCAPCDPATTEKYCQIITVESFFPFNGSLPDDGRIEGSTRTNDFSRYFFADVDLSVNDEDANKPGCFCGWESPLPNIFMLDPNDPFFGLPEYNGGSAVPLKFRVAATDGNPCGTYDYCAMPDFGYVTGAQVLLSVAKIYDANLGDVFIPMDPSETSGDDSNLFGNPNNPSTPYHYNLDTTGYEPGVYQAVAVALTDNFAVDWTYFAIR